MQALLEHAQRIRDRGQTALLVVTSEDRLAGVIGVADQVRPEAAATMAALRRLGIAKLVILTGDHERVARAIASVLGASDVRAGLLPEQKVVELRRLAEDGGYVAMVGDGVNDVPALKEARLAVAQGSGVQMARSVADLVLVRGDFAVVPGMVAEGRQILRNVQRFARLFVTMAETLSLWDRGAGIAKTIEQWRAAARGIGETITVNLPDRSLSGRFAGIDETGRLMLDTGSGTMQAIAAGDVFFG